MIRSEFFVSSSADHGAQIHVRSVTPAIMTAATPIVMCLHGAAMHNIIFDVPIETDYPTFLEYLAHNGYAAYAISYRGYGASSKPVPFHDHPLPSRCLMRYDEACQDVIDVINHVQHLFPASKINICGLSWGSVIAGAFINQFPNLINKLVLFGPVYSYPNPAWAALLNPENTQEINPALGSYRILTKDQITAVWDAEISVSDKTLWRNPVALDAIIKEMLDSDRTWAAQQPDPEVLRLCTGVLQDIVEVYNQRPLYQAASILCPTLILRGAYDSLSPAADAEGLLRELGAEDKKMITFGNATHYALAERRAKLLWQEVITFFNSHS